MLRLPINCGIFFVRLVKPVVPVWSAVIVELEKSMGNTDFMICRTISLYIL
jgi:hypothetical protein